MPSAAIASPATSPAASPTGTAPAFFVRAGHRLADRRAHRADLQPVTPAAPTLRSVPRLALLPDATRRGGLRAVRVVETDRYAPLSGSRVIETRWPHADHYVPWARLAQNPRAAGAKLRALLSRPAAGPERLAKKPVTTDRAAA
jgi:hypothetical protein